MHRVTKFEIVSEKALKCGKNEKSKCERAREKES